MWTALPRSGAEGQPKRNGSHLINQQQMGLLNVLAALWPQASHYRQQEVGCPGNNKEKLVEVEPFAQLGCCTSGAQRGLQDGVWRSARNECLVYHQQGKKKVHSC